MKNSKIQGLVEEFILPFVNKPARYTGNEFNTIHKDISSVSVRIALAFPEVYEIAMSYVGFGILYHQLNKEPDVWAERVNAPWIDMESRLREVKVPLFSLESFTPLTEFDLIGFTLQYELTYTNILNMLDMAGIPLLAAERKESDPLIIAGGPCSCNPEPMADFMDAFFIGDGEEAVLEIAAVLRQAKQLNWTRPEKLSALAGIRGIYVPAFHQTGFVEAGGFLVVTGRQKTAPERILTRIIPELKSEYYPEKPLVPLIDVEHNRLAVETMRGCTEGCRYCNAGMIYRPTRERPVDEIINYVDKALANTGYEELSFLSLSISDYSRLPELMQKEQAALRGRNINVSFPSMRLDSFNEEIAGFISTVRKSGFTFAPEAGSARLRRVINKNVSDDDLFNSVKIALQNGWRQLKFYFMIGLPTETEEDVVAIADLLEQVVNLSKAFGFVQFHVSVSPFAPKAHTPFQWERQNSIEELKHKVVILRSRFRFLKQVKLSWRDAEVAALEGILGRGDRRQGRVILEAWRNGARFDGWTDFFNWETWVQAFQTCQVDMNLYTASLDLNQALPWDHIDKGVTRNFLRKQRDEAYREAVIIDCKEGTCFGCGIQRKGGFREFADCYTKLELHHPQPAGEPDHQSPGIIVTEQQVEPGRPAFIRYRVRYSKSEMARYIGHLDLARIFARACSRAAVPVIFSEGYNPHPKIAFGQPLSLGVSSEAEFFDIDIREDYQKDLAGELNPLLPQGVRIVEVEIIRTGLTSLSNLINLAVYEADLSRLGLDPAVLSKSVQQIADSEEISIERLSKGRRQQIDIKPFIEKIEWQPEQLKITTRTIESRTVRMSEVLTVLLQDTGIDVRRIPVHRLEQKVCALDQVLTPYSAAL